jgi:hypothetical protein
MSPEIRPKYANAALDSYGQAVGKGERDDPFHYAPSLVARILDTPGQEMASHTFSHYYCLEPGQGLEAFEADLAAFGRIADTWGFMPRSIVFPRNQLNLDYGPALARNGYFAYRGNPAGFSACEAGTSAGLGRRILRSADLYVNIYGRHTYAPSGDNPGGLRNVPASFMFRPWTPRLATFEWLRLRRLMASLRYAVRSNQIMHIWFHPHNFGLHTDENMRVLDDFLEIFTKYRDEYGLLSLGMKDASRQILCL